MSNKFYAPLGPPPKQPRRLRFEPANGRRGRGEVDPELQNSPTKLRNVDLLADVGVENVDSSKVAVKAGDILIAATPFVFVLSTSCRGTRCDGCFRKLDKRKGPMVCDCKFAYFCSADCRTADALHSEECRILQRRGKCPTSDIARYVLRAVLKIRSGGLSEADLVPGNPEPRHFFHLVDHFDDILEHSGHRRNLIEDIYTEILDFMGEEEAPDPDYFLTIYGRIAVNSFSIIDGTEQDSIGSGLYLGPSIFDHSCVPNAAASFLPDRTIVIRALEDFPERDYSKFFITYIDLMDFTGHRRNHLKTNYYFLCQCPRCSDDKSDRDMFSIVCKKCQKPEVFASGIENIPESLDCSNCQETYSGQDLESYVDICEIVRDKLNEVTIPFDVASFCINQMSRVGFGPFHIYVIQATLAAFEGAVYMFDKKQSKNNLDLLRRAHGHGLHLVEAYERYRRSKYWACQGLLLARMAQIETELGLDALAEEHLKRAEDILKVAHGGIVLRGFNTPTTLNGEDE